MVAPRWILYPPESTATKYPGNSQVVVNRERGYLVDPKENGVPFFITKDEIALYRPELYNLTEIPAQTVLKYAAGRVKAWQKIEGSGEEYLTVKHGNGTQKYRVSGRTIVALERVGVPWQKEPNKLEKLEQGLVEEITYKRLKQMLLPGDAVVVLPVWELPDFSKKDEAGEYLAHTLIIRRGRGL